MVSAYKHFTGYEAKKTGGLEEYETGTTNCLGEYCWHNLFLKLEK